MTNIAVLIPALNEEITIKKVVLDFKKEVPGCKIYVFDNGSTDNTSKLAKEAGAIVQQFKRRGKGSVMKAMFEEINADYYILVDGDDTYPADRIKDLLAPVVNDDADMTIGTRLENFQKEENRLLHNFGNKVIRASVNFCFNSKIKDMLSGYRVMNKDFVKNINLLASGFEIETELTIKALEDGYRIREIPVGYRERPPGSKSKLNALSDGTRILTTTLNLFRDYRPMQFFILLSFFSIAVAAGFGYVPIAEIIQSGKILHPYSFAMCMFFTLLSFQLFITGFITSSVHRLKEETMNVLRKIKRVMDK
ncbi:MAG: glycosyltransferase family 2 protein [archaeon]